MYLVPVLLNSCTAAWYVFCSYFVHMTSKINVWRLSLGIFRVYISINITTNLMQCFSTRELFYRLKEETQAWVLCKWVVILNAGNTGWVVVFIHVMLWSTLAIENSRTIKAKICDDKFVLSKCCNLFLCFSLIFLVVKGISLTASGH